MHLETVGSSAETLLLRITSPQAKSLVDVPGGQIRVTCLCPSAKGSEKTQSGRQSLTPNKTEETNSSTRKGASKAGGGEEGQT